jgi:hypothetical protein
VKGASVELLTIAGPTMRSPAAELAANSVWLESDGGDQNRAEDCKGLRYRMPELGAEVLRRRGATVLTTPGGEIAGARNERSSPLTRRWREMDSKTSVRQRIARPAEREDSSEKHKGRRLETVANLARNREIECIVLQPATDG